MDEPELVLPQLPDDLPARNLTAEDQSGVTRDDLTAAIVKVLFRKKNRNVLLHGDKGVGASTIPQLLAGALKSGRFPQLGQTHVIGFDLAALPLDEYERGVERVLALMEAEPGRIYALEGFAPYFTAHFADCARRFAANPYALILVVDTVAHTQLAEGETVLTDLFEVVEVPEPAAEVTKAILEQAEARLAAEYGVDFADDAVAAAMRMTSDYMISRRFPAKGVELLERAAADVAAEAEMTGSPNRQVTRRRLAKRVATTTGLPEETILGTGADKDYVDLLSRGLVGQEVAVAKAAGRLDLIQKGMVDKHGPAAVFVFAGLSGTGKTELAKQIAQLYSNSRSIIHFPMENFTEAHSVSGLIGSPPGYIGYEDGGKLVNALNRDPYSVVLLDEVEKAHPAIWDPFLNLFDEGDITDTRGVTASGTKAFFVMTSNIGQYEIADLLARGASQEEIEDTVMKLLPAFVHPGAGQPCFRPEFVGRIMRRGGIVAFNALSLEALGAITRHLFSKVAHDYSEVHDSKLVCDDDVLEMIARTIYEENSAVIRAHRPGYLGARRLSMLVDQHITNKLAAKLRTLAGAPLVRVMLEGDHTELVPVFDRQEAEAALAERRLALLSRVERRFNSLLTAPDEAFDKLDEPALARMDRLLAEVGAVL
jgi:ATP-dependent Clp protease ATP-binding subunit ClpA